MALLHIFWLWLLIRLDNFSYILQNLAGEVLSCLVLLSMDVKEHLQLSNVCLHQPLIND